MMNFVRYAENGTITSAGYMDEAAILNEHNNGERILTVSLSDGFDWSVLKVDTKTLELVATEPSAPEPPSAREERSQVQPISDKQFYTKAAFDGLISQDDAIKAVQTGFVPPPMQAFIDTIQDADVRFAATMLFAGETTIYRQHPLIEGFFLEQGKDADAMDRFFAEARAM